MEPVIAEVLAANQAFYDAHEARAGPGRNQFILTNEAVAVHGDTAWVTLDENLVDSGGTGTVAATNLFVLSDGRWLLVAHHGSPVIAS